MGRQRRRGTAADWAPTPQLRQIDRMTLYDSHEDHTVCMTGVSGLLVSDLKALDLLSDDQVERLGEVAHLVEDDQPFCSEVRLLDAWLDAFELMTSVREEDYRK